MKTMGLINIALTKDELSIIISTVGATLATFAGSADPGQPATPLMLQLEALQAKLMKAE